MDLMMNSFAASEPLITNRNSESESPISKADQHQATITSSSNSSSFFIKDILSSSKVNIGNKKYSNANIQDLILNGASIPRELASFTSSQTSKLFNQIDSSRSGSPSGEYSHSPISNGSNGYNSPQHFPQPPPPMTILPHSSHLSHQSLAGHLTSPTPNSAAAAAAAAAAAFFGEEEEEEND
ncbi:hypothetical protein BLOT_008487 [Blomia tropicalis]|nr:hypothetical protein BLOT_008487 [Blomia tropicalis]